MQLLLGNLKNLNKRAVYKKNENFWSVCENLFRLKTKNKTFEIFKD